MIRIAIAEDMENERNRLVEYIRRYEKTCEEDFQLFCFQDGSALVEEYPKDCDILLLDIEMKPMNGLDAAREIRAIDENVIIIFITNMVQFALEGYAVDAMNFVVKPISYQAFAGELTRALNRIVKRRPSYLKVKSNDGVFLLDIRDITYVETFKHKVMIHTRSKSIPCNESMSSLEKKLEEHPFFRCHTAFLVNMDYVERVQGNDVWVAGEQLAISRHRRKEFLDILTQYVGDWA